MVPRASAVQLVFSRHSTERIVWSVRLDVPAWTGRSASSACQAQLRYRAAAPARSVVPVVSLTTASRAFRLTNAGRILTTRTSQLRLPPQISVSSALMAQSVQPTVSTAALAQRAATAWAETTAWNVRAVKSARRIGTIAASAQSQEASPTVRAALGTASPVPLANTPAATGGSAKTAGPTRRAPPIARPVTAILAGAAYSASG